MMTRSVQTTENLTLIGAGDVNKEVLSLALTYAPYLVAADGGAKLALNYGKTPNYLIGDFDSVDGDARARIPARRHLRIDDQDSTDFEKCLRVIDAPLIVGVGFLGRRLDHQLAALSALVRHADVACVLIGAHDAVFHVPKTLDIKLTPGTRFSLFPMRPVTGRSAGLKWPIEGLSFAPGARVGTSNRVIAPQVRLTMDGPGMLVIVPRAALPDVVAALTQG
jgi:thiamine pyrophosphokinase